MRRKQRGRLVRPAAVAVLVGGLVAAAPSPDAAPDVAVVAMGAVDPEAVDPTAEPGGDGRTDRFEYLAFYPERLRVHRGDTVLFRRDGFHGVVFAPDPDAQPLHTRRDELPGSGAMQWIDPTDPTCGADVASACVLSDGQQVLTSGWSSMHLRFDVPAGTYAFFCGLHEGMRGEVEVVADDEVADDPAAVERERQRQVEADTGAGARVIAAGQVPEVEVVDGRRVWQVRAGDFTADGRVAVLRFLPANLEVEPGDEVEFVVPDAPRREIHTASFPASAWPFGFFSYLDPRCDPDDPSTGSPGVSLQYALVLAGTECPAGATMDFGLQPWAYRTPISAPGAVLATPSTVHDTGWLAPASSTCRFACDPWDDAVRMPDRSRVQLSAEGVFSYQCNIHPEWGMAGSIRVAA